MLLGTGYRHREGIAVFPSGSADPLNILRLSGRHLAQHNCGEISDIDTHFQRRRTGQEIRIPRVVRFLAVLKRFFQCLTVLSLQKA